MATSKAAKVSDVTFDHGTPPVGGKAGGKLKWKNNATDATGIRIESQFQDPTTSVWSPWKTEGNLPPTATEKDVGGFEQGSNVRFGITPLKP